MSITKTIHYLKKLKKLFTSNQRVQEEPEESIALRNAAANQRRNDIVTAFARHVGSNPVAGEIRDVSTLPYPKEEILSAFSIDIVREDNPERRDLLKAVIYQLADYQKEIGPNPIRTFGMSFDDFKQIGREINQAESTKEEGILVAAAVKRLSNPEAKRYRELQKLVEEDRLHIQSIIQAAELVRENMPTKKKRTILG